MEVMKSVMKQKHINPSLMSLPTISISESFKKRVWLVAFDMDQTCLDVHTTGIGVRDNKEVPYYFDSSPYKPLKASEIVNHVKDVVKVIIPELLKNGIAVAICTNTDVLMASHPDLMGGRELVEYIFGNTFEDYPDICDHLIIEAWRGEIQAVKARGKNNHLARVWERIDSEHKQYSILNEMSFQQKIRSYCDDYFESLTQIDPFTRSAMKSHTLLIDDDFLNVNLAKREGYMAYKVPITGLEFSDWETIVKSIDNESA